MEDLLANDRELLIMSHLLQQSEAYLVLGQMFLAVSQLDVIHRFYSVLIKCKYMIYDVFQYWTLQGFKSFNQISGVKADCQIIA